MIAQQKFWESSEGARKLLVGHHPMKAAADTSKKQKGVAGYSTPSKDFSLEQDHFGMKAWNVLPSLGLKVITNGKNATVALGGLFPLYMGSLDQKVDMDQVKTDALKTRWQDV